MVNYPHKISSKKNKTSISQPNNFANRGMTFEKMINGSKIFSTEEIFRKYWIFS